MLGHRDFVNVHELTCFLETTKSKYGGYGKVADAHPDIMHSYMGLVSSIIFNPDNQQPFCTFLGIRKSHVPQV